MAFALVGCSNPGSPQAHQPRQPVEDTEAAAPTVRPIRWMTDDGELTLIGTRDFETLFAMPVVRGDQSEGPTFQNDSGATARPVTCDEYFRLIDSGFYPPTTFDMSMASFFVLRCDTLRYIQHALPAKQSSIEDFRLTTRSLDDLPAALAPTWSDDDGESGEERVSPGGAWRTAYPADVIRQHDSASIEVTNDAFITNLRIVAWADFDRDGFEDVLLYLAVHANGGTFRYYCDEAVTRLTADHPLTVVRLNNAD